VIGGKIDGGEAAVKAIRMVPARVFKEAKRIIAAEGVFLAGQVRKRWLTGGTSATQLAVRTGNLRSQCKALQLTETANSIEGGIGFGTSYAAAHIGPEGQVTTIRPMRGKWLTIPLDAAKTKAGVARGSARSGMWGETFIAKSKQGNLILFGKKVAQKGKHAGEARGNVVPLFLLVKQVKIRARVHPETILAFERPHIVSAFQEIGIRLKG
jgi:hypothetical protein